MSNPYKLVTLNSPGWAVFDAATLLISVGQPYHEGDKLAAAIEWSARHFKNLHILVADTLQRHNELADWLARGGAWIERNQAAWAAYGQRVTLSRWNEWLARPEYSATLEQFRKAAGGGLLHAALDRDAAAFVARHRARDLNAAIEQSRGYLLEELAAITLQARAFPGARVYPGPELASFRAVAQGLVSDAPPGLERQYHTAVDFKRRALAISPVEREKPQPLPVSEPRYRVRVNSCPDWVAYSSCTLGISVGQPYHEGDKFAAMVEWAARHFDHIRVDVSDSLQRHRLIGEGIPAEEAARTSLREGDRWIARAMPVLGNCGKHCTVVRWNEWLRHADFPAVHGAYTRLAQSDAVLSAAIAADIDGFTARREKHAVIADAEAIRTASQAYLLEELAVITLQGRQQSSARLYPGPELASFHAVRSGRVAGAPVGLERDCYVHVNLERRKAAAPRLARAAPLASVLKIA